MPFTLTNFHCIYCGTKDVYRDEMGELSTQQQHYCVTCGRTFRTGAQELNDFHTKRMAELLADLEDRRVKPQA